MTGALLTATTGAVVSTVTVPLPVVPLLDVSVSALAPFAFVSGVVGVQLYVPPALQLSA